MSFADSLTSLDEIWKKLKLKDSKDGCLQKNADGSHESNLSAAVYKLIAVLKDHLLVSERPEWILAAS